MFLAAVDYRNPASFGSKLRRRRARFVKDLIEASHRETGGCRIIDIGGTEDYWSILGSDYIEEHNVHVTLANVLPTSVSQPRFTSIVADGCDLSGIEDQEFDLAHSNSVIEHVGHWRRVECFAREFRRVARRYYLQTPNFWFPWEPHFNVPLFHWLPEPVRMRMQMAHGFGNYPRSPDMRDAFRHIQDIHLLDRRMLRNVFPDGEVFAEKVLGVAKSLMVVRRQPPN